MAAPKKRNARSTPRRGHAEQREGRDQFTVVLEDLHAKFDVFGGALQGTQARLANVETGLEDARRELRAGFARIEAVLDKRVDRDEVQAMIARGLAGR